MFIELNDGQLINTYWLNTLFKDEEDATRVVFEMVNGVKRYEKFDTVEEADDRIGELITLLTGGDAE